MYNRINNNNIYFQNKNINKKDETKLKTFEEQIIDITNEMYENSKGQRVPEYGDFSPLYVYMPNLDKNTNIDKYGLKLYKMRNDVDPDPKMRYLEAAIYLPDSDYKLSLVVLRGHKDEILNKIKDKDFQQKLNLTFGELLAQIEQ